MMVTDVVAALDARLAGVEASLRRQNFLLAAQFLQDAAVALDLLQQFGFAERAFFTANVTVAALATATAIDITTPPTMVGFWRELSIVPDQSFFLQMQVLVDQSQILLDNAVVARDIIPESVWLPFKTEFKVNLTNTDGAGSHRATILGTRVFLQAVHWQRIQRVLARAVGLAEEAGD